VLLKINNEFKFYSSKEGCYGVIFKKSEMKGDYKKSEEKHYDKKVQIRKHSQFSYSDYVLRSSADYYFSLINQQLNTSHNFQILDYGCGTGHRHFEFSNRANHIVGVDISSRSIEIANQQAKKHMLNAEYLIMDCEKMTFADRTFDLILDFGTFSSLDIEQATEELIRVLKKDGIMICIETYGHNPFMKIKRLLNVLCGKRTKWAAKHIMKKHDWELIASKFECCNIDFFHFLVLFLPVFLKILPKALGNKILLLTEKIDSKILKKHFFQFLAFKTVVVLRKPLK